MLGILEKLVIPAFELHEFFVLYFQVLEKPFGAFRRGYLVRRSY